MKDVWQSSINGSVTGAEVLASGQRFCSQTKTAGVDDDPFFAIDFGKTFVVMGIVIFAQYHSSGKPLISSPSVDYTYGDLGPLLLVNSDSGIDK